jgi:hypothetical protein
MQITEDSFAHHKEYTNKIIDRVMELTESFQKTDLFKQSPKKDGQRLNGLKAKVSRIVNINLPD